MKHAAVLFVIIFGFALIVWGTVIGWNSNLGSPERESMGLLIIPGAILLSVGVVGLAIRKGDGTFRIPKP